MFVVFNAGPPRGTTAYIEAAEVATMIGFQVTPMHLTERAAFHVATHVATRGRRVAQEMEPDGKAAGEMAALWDWIRNQLKLQSRNHRIKMAGNHK